MSNQDPSEITLSEIISVSFQAVYNMFEQFSSLHQNTETLPLPTLDNSLLDQENIPPLVLLSLMPFLTMPMHAPFLSEGDSFAQTQTASMHAAHSATSSSPPPDSQNETLLAQRGISSHQIPEQYKCSITDEVMDVPVYDPKLPNIKFDRKNIEYHLKNYHTHPHTNLPLKASDLIVDTTLKAVIEAFVKGSLVIYSNKYTSNGGLVARTNEQLLYSESCAILEVTEDANIDEIKHAYHKKAKLLHLDRSTLSETEANQQFNRLKKAYDSLLGVKHATLASALRLEYAHNNLVPSISAMAASYCFIQAIMVIILVTAVIMKAEQDHANKPTSSSKDDFCGFKPGFLL
jgi:hypothetical protein